MKPYNQLCTEFYDLDKPNEPADAFQFYLEYAQAAQGPILEPMCGSGRFLLPLLARGFDIDGVDASPCMLEACRKRAAQQRLTPKLLEQNLEALELSRRYALAFIPAGSFGFSPKPRWRTRHSADSMQRSCLAASWSSKSTSRRSRRPGHGLGTAVG